MYYCVIVLLCHCVIVSLCHCVIVYVGTVMFWKLALSLELTFSSHPDVIMWIIHSKTEYRSLYMYMYMYIHRSDLIYNDVNACQMRVTAYVVCSFSGHRGTVQSDPHQQ